MRLLGVLILLLGVSAVEAQQIQATPNTPAASGDQLWLLRDGKIVRKLNGNTFTSGELISVNGIAVGSAMCPPRQPEPPAYPPPQFEAPKPEVVPVAPPAVPEVTASGGPSLLQIIAFVTAVVGGYYVGRKAAADDEDDTEAPAEPAAVA